ncbi:MAG: hypothetical protein M3N08_04455, partial [Pseudomonadota bacterium]|nr:hypothetical protein [Pseudomonadota bacterium]
AGARFAPRGGATRQAEPGGAGHDGGNGTAQGLGYRLGRLVAHPHFTKRAVLIVPAGNDGEA